MNLINIIEQFFNRTRPSQKHQPNTANAHIFPGYLSVPTFLQSKNDQKWKSVDGWEGTKKFWVLKFG